LISVVRRLPVGLLAGVRLAGAGALGPRLDRLAQRLSNALVGWKLFVLALAVLATARIVLLLKIYFSLPDDLVPAAHMAWLQPLQRVVYALCAWRALMAVCGFAHRHLNFDSAARRYLAQAVAPVYIVHQTLIVSTAHALKPVRFAPGIEAILLVILTITISFGIFELVRRVALLQPDGAGVKQSKGRNRLVRRCGL
jgi:hypothetical protein